MVERATSLFMNSLCFLISESCSKLVRCDRTIVVARCLIFIVSCFCHRYTCTNSIFSSYCRPSSQSEVKVRWGHVVETKTPEDLCASASFRPNLHRSSNPTLRGSASCTLLPVSNMFACLIQFRSNGIMVTYKPSARGRTLWLGVATSHTHLLSTSRICTQLRRFDNEVSIKPHMFSQYSACYFSKSANDLDCRRFDHSSWWRTQWHRRLGTISEVFFWRQSNCK